LEVSILVWGAAPAAAGVVPALSFANTEASLAAQVSVVNERPYDMLVRLTTFVASWGQVEALILVFG